MVQRSLQGQEIAGEEESVLEAGLGMLDAVYNELDDADRQLRKLQR